MGRPRKYENADEMGKAIDAYFESLKGVDDKPDKIPTVAGLALKLGFSSRQSLNDYEKDERFSYLIKKARLTIENEWEQMLQKQSCTGAIFWLKNHSGYVDKHEQEISGKNGEAIGFRFVDPPAITPKV